MWDFKKNLRGEQKGFTLVEFLIVIMIIGMLSTLAVNGYTQYRKSALLDLAADNLISQINELREKTIRGDFNSGRLELVLEALENDTSVEEDEVGDAKCFGLVFDAVSGEMNSFSESFKGQKVFKLDQWVYAGCGESDQENLMAVELGDQVVIDKITLVDSDGNEVSVEKFLLRFLPPNGDLEVETDGTALNFVDHSAQKKVKFQIKYGLTEDLQFKRAIFFDFINLNAEVHEGT